MKNMNAILLFAAQQIAAFGINKGLNKIFESKENFSGQLYKVISKTIDEYQEKFPEPDTEGKFSFYKSQILIEEFLKFRLFAQNGYTIDANRIQNALERNPNIIKPSQEQLEVFFNIFDSQLRNDAKLKSLEIEAFHKEAIFGIYDKVEQILNMLQVHLVEIVGLLEEEYKEEINSCYEEIKVLKLHTGLKRLTQLEERINRNSKHISDKIQASLNYFKAVCFETLGMATEAYENFIIAYKKSPENKQYLEKACISYYFLNNPKYEELKILIEESDEFSTVCWAIKTFESANLESFIKESVPPNVLKKHHYKRLVFNHNFTKNKVDNLLLMDILEVSKLSKELPELINYDNIHHWVFILNTLSIDYFSSCEIPFLGFIQKNEKSILYLELSKLLSKSIVEGELDTSYNTIVFAYYWMESELERTSSGLTNLKNAYHNLKEKDSFRTLLFANSIQKHESIQDAIKIIDCFEGEMDGNLISLKTFCLLDNPQTEETVAEYFKYIRNIDELNIQNTCSFLIPIIKSNIISKECLLDYLNHVDFSTNEYKKLIYLLVDTLYVSDTYLPISSINEIKVELETERKLFFHVAFLYFENKYFEECAKFQESYLDENKETRDLFLYIRALNNNQSNNQLKLLRLLKYWRLNFTFNDYLLRIEIELLQILKDWKEIQIITEHGLSKLPEDDQFFTLFLISLAILEKPERIKEEIPKIVGFKFLITENALRVAGILIKFNYLREGLEIIYQKAINKNDSLARMNYFSLTTNFPIDYFKEYEIVSIDCYVKYEIDGELETIIVNSSTLSNPIVKNSIGKKPQETFTVENKLTKKLKQVRVIRIMNKYLALSDSIVAEANSSFSNLPVESIKFESTDKEGIEKSFIENFGAIEDERRKHTEQNLRDYHSFKLSFFEIVNSNFEGSFIDAYYILTSSQSDGYLIKPLKYLVSGLRTDKNQIIIDFSSGILFFELSEKLGISFEKFIISENLFSLIDNLIYKTESARNSKMSISIYKNRIVPHFYPDDFHDKRIDFLVKLKMWFKENTDALIPEEKIEIIRPLYADGKMTTVLEYIVDNAFLAQRANHILLSDDIGYGKMLHVNNCITTEKYLTEKFPARKNEILEFMLNLRYIGISINSDILYSTYINHNKEGYNHLYNYALRNIALKENFNAFNIFIAVDFLKQLALSPIITKEKYKLDATNLIAMILSSFPNPLFTLTLKTRIEQKFKLMGDYLNLTLLALIDALNINNRV